MDGRILIFAGAGASKAVKPDKFPTTQEFFDELLSPITQQPLFALAVDFIRQKTKSQKVDIEQVLWALQNLHEFFENISTSKDIAGYFLHQGIIERLYQGHNIGHMLQVSSPMRDRIAALIGEINEIVYDLYSYEPTPAELKNNWDELISACDGVGSRLDIFTTNYDVVIEAALNRIHGETTAREWRGIRGNVRQTIDLAAWGESQAKVDGRLTKLHGSLDWKRRGDQIHVGDPVFTGDHSKHAIIYPGFKGESSAPFFHVFHNYLADAIAESDLLIFIGFAFRDEHINQIIRENLRISADVIVLNPDDSVKFPSTRANVWNVRRGFDKSSVKEITGPYLT